MSAFGNDEPVHDTHNQTANQGYQNTYDNRHSLTCNQVSANQRVAEHTGSDGKVNTACNQTEGYADSKECQVVCIIHDT